MSSVALQRRPQKAPPDLPAAPLSMPTLFGEGYGQYRTRASTFVFSFLAHTVAVALLVLAGRFAAEHRHEVRQQVISIVTDVSPYVLPPSASKAGGGVAEATATSWRLQRERCLVFRGNNWRLL
jgi:hypothetical protein